MYKQHDIFYKTRLRIMIISNLIVFLCLLIFVFIFQTIYSSNIYKDIDNALINRIYHTQEELIRADIIDRAFRNINIQDVFDEKMDSTLMTILYENQSPVLCTPNFYFDINNISQTNIKDESKIENIKINGFNFRGLKYKYNQYDVEIIANVDYQLKSIDNMKNSIYMALLILLLISIYLSKKLSDKVIIPIKSAYDKQVYFVQDASHEMKTPLTVIKGKLELLSRNLNDSEQSFEYISKIMKEIRGLEKLNSDLLFLSKEDIGFKKNIKTLNLNKFIDNISDFYIDLSEIHQKEFEIIKRNNIDIEVEWDEEKIKRSITILIENAFKYTNQNDKIILEVINNNKNIIINVIDSGIGIKEDNIQRVFDRFFRSDDVRAKNISGSGIGLSLLKTISTTLNFKIDLKSEYQKGSEFKLTIPKKL